MATAMDTWILCLDVATLGERLNQTQLRDDDLLTQALAALESHRIGVAGVPE
jgi:hypothetical protein